MAVTHLKSFLYRALSASSIFKVMRGCGRRPEGILGFGRPGDVVVLVDECLTVVVLVVHAVIDLGLSGVIS